MTTTHNFNRVSTLTIVTAVMIVCASSSASTTNSTTTQPATARDIDNSTRSPMHDSSQYMTLTTTPASAVVEVVTLNSPVAKNETLKAQEQNQFPAGPYGGPFVPGQSPLPPQLIAALQRRQQLLQAQNGGRPVSLLQLLQGFLPGGPGGSLLANLTPFQRQQLQQQLLRNQALQRQLAQRGRLQGVNVNNNNNNNQGGGDESNGGGGEGDGQGGGEGQEEPQQNPQDDPDLRQLQNLQGGNDGNFPGDGGSIFEGLFPPGILSQQDIKDIEKGIEEQRKKEEEEKRQREEEEAAREQAANEEENNANGQGDQGANNGANDQNQGQPQNQQPQQPQQQQPQQPYYPQPQQPVVYPQPGQYPPPQNNLVNHNLAPNNPTYPVQGGYPGQVAPQNPYQPQPQQPQQPQGYTPGFAQIPNQQPPQVAPVQPQQPNYLPGVQQIPGGLYPNGPVTPPPQIAQQQPVVPYGQGQLTPQQPQPQSVPGYNPGTVGGYPVVNPINHQQQPQQPPQTRPLNPLNGLAPQINPNILGQLSPALLQQYGQQLRNGGPFNPLSQGSPLAGQLNPGQLNQLNQLIRQNQPGAGQQQTPFTPFNPLTAFVPRTSSPVGPGGAPGSPNQPPPSIGSILRGAGRALGIPGLASGSDPREAPYTTDSPPTTPDYGAIRNRLAERQPQSYEGRSRRPYEREDDRRNPYPDRGFSAGVDYEGERDSPNNRSPYRAKYERTRGERPSDRFAAFGRVKDEARKDRDYGSDYRAGVEYNEVDDQDNGRYGDISARPRQGVYEDDRLRDRDNGSHPRTDAYGRTLREEVGQAHRGYQSPRDRTYERSRSRFDDESDLNRNRANPFLVG